MAAVAGEIDSTADGFVDAVFRLDGHLRVPPSSLTKRDYVARALRGGYPEAVRRDPGRRPAKFFDSYVTDLVTRDVRQISDIERSAEMRRFVIKRIPAWSSNLTTRAISTPKLIVTDSGLGGRLIGMSEERAKDPTAPVGPLLENFANRLGDRLRAGIVLYAGEQQLSFGDRLAALPMAALWTLDSSAH